MKRENEDKEAWQSVWGEKLSKKIIRGNERESDERESNEKKWGEIKD